MRHVQLAVLVPAHQVHVTVEQTREQRLAVASDDLVAVEPGSDVDDPAVLDHDVRGGERRTRPIEDRAAVEQRPRHRHLPIRRPER